MTPAAASRSRRRPGFNPLRASKSSGVEVRPDAGKDRHSAGNSRFGGMREVEGVIAGQKHPEDIGAADDGDDAVWRAERLKRLLEARAGRIPMERMGMSRIGRDSVDLMRNDETAPPIGARAAFVRMTSVHQRCGVVEAVLEEFLVGVVLDHVRHVTVRVGDHAVSGNDDETFDAQSGQAQNTARYRSSEMTPMMITMTRTICLARPSIGSMLTR